MYFISSINRLWIANPALSREKVGYVGYVLSLSSCTSETIVFPFSLVSRVFKTENKEYSVMTVWTLNIFPPNIIIGYRIKEKFFPLVLFEPPRSRFLN